MSESLLAGDVMYERFGLTNYLGLVTGEMKWRPIPHVFESKLVKPLVDLYTEWCPHIIDWYVPQLEPPYQAYNAVSKVGWPAFMVPKDKLAYMETRFPAFERRDLSEYANAYAVCNVRLQVESRLKEREFQYLDGLTESVIERLVNAADRTIRTPLGPRVSSRSRLIFNMPDYNLYKQVLDSAIHNALLKHRAFHHDMFNDDLLPVVGYHLCFDVKHFERSTAQVNRVRSQHLGGFYSMCGDNLARIPVAAPTMQWDGARFLYVDRDGGYSEQYGSGDSAVAPSQKEIFIALYGEFFKREYNLTYLQAIELVARGGDAKLTIRNYGDDNSINGDKATCRAFFDFAKQYIHIEEEEPPKFLGFVRGERWELPMLSYLTKNWNAERAPYTSFRKYPNMGLVAKRAIYAKLGQAIVNTEVIPEEDKLLAKLGLPYFEIMQKAQEEERRAAQSNAGQLNKLWVLEKDYAMSAQEKIATGLFTGLTPQRTLPIVKNLLGSEHHKRLTGVLK